MGWYCKHSTFWFPSELAETCTGTNLTVTNLSVTGITYEDVKNVDSLGIVTARSDVRVGRNLNVVGIATVSTAFYWSTQQLQEMQGHLMRVR